MTGFQKFEPNQLLAESEFHYYFRSKHVSVGKILCMGHKRCDFQKHIRKNQLYDPIPNYMKPV